MIEGSGDDALLQHYVAAQRGGIGRFTAEPDSGRWAWSPALYGIFGITPDLSPSWDLIVAHIPESERDVVEEAYRLAGCRVGPFSWSHRILVGDGLVRSVMVIGETTSSEVAADGSADVRGEQPGRCLRGYVIDLTGLRIDAAGAAAQDAVQQAAVHRATIEQAKGVVMLAYGLTPDAAFQLLAWRSQRANRKLHRIAADLVGSLRDNNIADSSFRALIDKLLDDAAESP